MSCSLYKQNFPKALLSLLGRRQLFKVTRQKGTSSTSYPSTTKVSPGSKSSGPTTGNWRPDEHSRFIEAMVSFGRDWNKICSIVGTRNSAQCRSHAQKFFRYIEKLNGKNALKDLEAMDKTNEHSFKERLIRYLKSFNFHRKNSKVGNLWHKTETVCDSFLTVPEILRKDVSSFQCATENVLNESQPLIEQLKNLMETNTLEDDEFFI